VITVRAALRPARIVRTILVVAIVVALTQLAVTLPVSSEPVHVPDGTPMVLEFVATTGKVDPYVLLGESNADEDETVCVKVDWGFDYDDGGSPVRAVTFLTEPGIYFGSGVTLAAGVTAEFPAEGTYSVTISPLLPADSNDDGCADGPWLTLFGAFRGEANPPQTDFFDDAAALTRVVSFGDLGITGLSSAFARSAIIDVPDALPPGVTHLDATFYGAVGFNDSDVAAWDVSSVVDMSAMFRDATSFNQPLANWERTGSTLANVVSMENMFEGASVFNQPIGSWDVSSVEFMGDMFEDAVSFNNGGSDSIKDWDVSNVTDMENMFEGASVFNQPIGSWDVSSVTDMSDMFYDASAFNQPIGSWNVSNVTRMDNMFRGATSLNQPLAGWQRAGSTLANVTRMDSMFRNATSFDQPLATWDVSSVTRMENMFRGASSFDRSLGAWSLASSVDLSSMLDSSGMSSSCYDATLVGWSTLSPPVNGRSLGAVGREYSPIGAAARSILVTDRSWTITGDDTVEVATGRCVDESDGGLGGGSTDGSSAVTITCSPTDPAAGATVTCQVRGGDPDIDVLWRAAAGSAVVEGAVRLGPDGQGTFTFLVPRTALGLPLTVELVAWTGPVPVGTVGGPIPSSVPAGEGRGPAGLLAGVVAVLALGITVSGTRSGRVGRIPGR